MQSNFFKKNLILVILMSMSIVLFMACPSPGGDPEPTPTPDANLPDIVVPLGADDGGQGNTTPTDNGDGSWTIAYTQGFGWYQRNLTDAPVDLTGYTTLTVVISNSIDPALNHGIKLDIQGGDSTPYSSIFNNSNNNWKTLTNGATEESITWDIANATLAPGQDLSKIQNVILQNNSDAYSITIHSITFSAEVDETMTVPLGDDQSPDNTSVTDNGDDSWTVNFQKNYGSYQNNLTDGPVNLSSYKTLKIVISNSLINATGKSISVKMEMQDDTWAGVFADNSTWQNLTPGQSEEALTWDLTTASFASGKDLSSIRSVVIQNNDGASTSPTSFIIIVHSITLYK